MTTNKTTSRTLRTIAAVAAVALIAAACGGDDTVVPEPAVTTDAATTTQPVVPDTTTSAQESEADADTDATVETDAPSETTTTVVDVEDGEAAATEEYASAVSQLEGEDGPEPEEALVQKPGFGPDVDSTPDEPLAEPEPEESSQLDEVPEPEADPEPEEASQPEQEPESEPQQAPEDNQPEPEQSEEDSTQEGQEAEQEAETTDTTDTADDKPDAALDVMDLSAELTAQAVVLWESDQWQQACALIDQANAAVDGHIAEWGTAGQPLQQSPEWADMMDVLAAWEADCVIELSADLTAEALVLWQANQYQQACVLIDQINSAVGAYTAEREAAGQQHPQTSAWVDMVNVLAGWDADCANPPEVWVPPVAGMVPEVRPNTPAPSWERAPLDENSYRTDDSPRATEGVQEWIEWCGPWSDCDWLLFYMVWALDYLGANESCILSVYYQRVIQTRRPGVSEAGRYRLMDQYGWHRCPTVIDPRTPTQLDSAVQGELVDIDVLLLAPNNSPMADRCRAVLPTNTELDLGDENVDCVEWGRWVEEDRITGVLYDECEKSRWLAREWLEHQIGMPTNFPGILC